MKLNKILLLGFLIGCSASPVPSLAMEDDNNKKFTASPYVNPTFSANGCHLEKDKDNSHEEIASSSSITNHLEGESTSDKTFQNGEEVLLFERFPTDTWLKILFNLEDFQDVLMFSCVSREASPLCLTVLNDPPELHWKWAEGPPSGTLSNFSWNKKIQQALSIALILHNKKILEEEQRLSYSTQNEKKIDIGEIKYEDILLYAKDIHLMYGAVDPSGKKPLVARFFEQVYLEVGGLDREIEESMAEIFKLVLPFSDKINDSSPGKVHQEIPVKDREFLNDFSQLGTQEKQLLVFWSYIVKKKECQHHRYFRKAPAQTDMALVQRFILTNNLRNQLNKTSGKELATLWNKIIEYGIDLTLSEFRSAANANLKEGNYQEAVRLENKILTIKGNNGSDYVYAARANFLAKNFSKATEIYNPLYGYIKGKKLFKLEDFSNAAKANFQTKNYEQAITIFDETLGMHDKYLYISFKQKNRQTPESEMRKKLLQAFYHRLEDLIFNARANFFIKNYKGACIQYGHIFRAQKDLEIKLGVSCPKDLLAPLLTRSDLHMARQANILEKNYKAVREISTKMQINYPKSK